MQIIQGGRRPVHAKIADLKIIDFVYTGSTQSKTDQVSRLRTSMPMDDDVITFQLPHPESTRSLEITLRSWSEGLKPWNTEEFLYVSGEAVRDHFHLLWKYPLNDIRRQIDPTNWALWQADIPDDLLVALRHHGLLQVGALYLIRQFPDMRQALSVGPFFLALLERWINDARDDGMAFANEQLC